VLSLVVEYNPDYPWGHLIEFEGTREQLIEAGVASCEMLDAWGRVSWKSGADEFGCKFTVEYRANQRFRLIRFLTEKPLLRGRNRSA